MFDPDDSVGRESNFDVSYDSRDEHFGKKDSVFKINRNKHRHVSDTEESKSDDVDGHRQLLKARKVDIDGRGKYNRDKQQS